MHTFNGIVHNEALRLSGALQRSSQWVAFANTCRVVYDRKNDLSCRIPPEKSLIISGTSSPPTAQPWAVASVRVIGSGCKAKGLDNSRAQPLALQFRPTVRIRNGHVLLYLPAKSEEICRICPAPPTQTRFAPLDRLLHRTLNERAS